MHALNEHAEIMLVASLAALFLGPVIHRFADEQGRVYSLLDGFVVIAVLGLALLEIVPYGVALAGWWAVLAVLAGLLLPSLAERHFGGKPTHRAAAWIALVGMAFHALTDGLALVSTHAHGHSHALEWAVILHRVPVGLAVWWMLTSPDGAGKRDGVLALSTIALATLVGYGLGGTTSVLEDSALVGMLEAFVGGLLLHVVSHGIGKRAAEHRTLTGIGGVAGLVAITGLFILPALEQGRGQATLDAFWDLLLESAPALVLAYGLAGLIGSVIGEGPIRWLRRPGKGAGAAADAQQAVRGVVFGLPLPLCSCGVVPVYRSLVDRRVPATAALAFLVATPELGLDAVLLSVPLLGVEMAVARVGVAFVLALVVGAFVGGWAQRQAHSHGHEHAHEHAHDEEPNKSFGARLVEGLRTGYGSILDSTGPWILVGLVLAAFIQPYVDAEFFTGLGPTLQVVAFALVGLPVYVCATGATPLVAVFIAKGLSPGAALAFLLTGPATNATTFGVLEQLHGRKVALAFTAAMIISVLGLGWGVNLLWPLLDFGGIEALTGAHHHEGHGWLAQASTGLLGVLFVSSLVRQGPRGFLGRLWELGGHDHDHDHDHDGHDHGDHDQPASSCCSAAPKPEPEPKPPGGSCCH